MLSLYPLLPIGIQLVFSLGIKWRFLSNYSTSYYTLVLCTLGICHSKVVMKLFSGYFSLIRGFLAFGIVFRLICHLQLLICIICCMPSEVHDVRSIVPSVKSVMSTCATSEVICEVSSEVPDVPMMWTCLVTCRCVYVSMFMYIMCHTCG